ncbi:MAG: hypothetical protein JSR15_04245 [Proteobacteria bacterium]|nr:hypothetical protein [Pseudomonadota bacterium]
MILPNAPRHLVAVLLVTLAVGGAGCSSRNSATPIPPVAPPPPPAQGVSYTDPTGTSWRLVKDAASTSTHLVLDLVGPAGTSGRGVALTVHGDGTRMSWGKLDGAYIKDGQVFDLAFDPTDPNEPRLLVGGVHGDDLLVGIFQKDPSASAKDLGTTLYSIAIDFKSGTALKSGDVIPLSVTKSRMLPGDLSAGKLEDISVAVGTLKAS